MLNIGSFFEKFKNATLKEMMLRQSVIDAVFANVNPQIAKAIKIELKDVELKNKIIRIRVSAIFKNEIFIKKTLILNAIKEKNPNQIIIDLQ